MAVERKASLLGLLPPPPTENNEQTDRQTDGWVHGLGYGLHHLAEITLNNTPSKTSGKLLLKTFSSTVYIQVLLNHLDVYSGTKNGTNVAILIMHEMARNTMLLAYITS